jgi:hypothetical protein
LTEKGDDVSPTITGAVGAISNIDAIEVAAKITRSGDSGTGHRVVTVRLGAGDPIVVDTFT